MEDNRPPIIAHHEINLFAILGTVLLSLLILSMIFGLRARNNEPPVSETETPSSFPEIALTAKAAYVYDVRTKTVLFAKEENTRLPLASLTKIMSALTARELADPHRAVTITPEALRMEGDSGFRNGQRWSLAELLDFSLVTSSNDGMRAVALALGALERTDATSDEMVNDFIGKMNKKASDLGLKNTYFWNETGLDESEMKGGAYGTARDVSMLLGYILEEHSDLLVATREPILAFHSLDNSVYLARNTNTIVSEIPGLLASKTGYTNTAGGNLAIVFDPELGRPIVVTVLGSTTQGRFEDVRTLVAATMEYIGQH